MRQVGADSAALAPASSSADTDAAPSPVSPRALQDNVASIAEAFMLSEREAQVLALYAEGYTQKSVAAQLGCSIYTAHTHIAHIYSKTGFHSRQDILDYMRRYGA